MIARSWALAALISLLACAPALADSVAVDLRIEGSDSTIFEGSVRTDAKTIDQDGDHRCDGTEKSNGGRGDDPGPTVTTALDDGYSNWDGDFNDGFKDYFITKIGPDEQSFSSNRYWGLVRNFSPLERGGCQVRVSDGDDVLFVYDLFQGTDFDKFKRLLKLTGPERAQTGESVSVRVEDGRTGAAVEGAEVGGVRTNGDGRAELRFSTAGTQGLKAEASGSIRSNRLDLCVYAPGTATCGAAGTTTPTTPGTTGTVGAGPAITIVSPRSRAIYRRAPRALSGRVTAQAGVRGVYFKLRRYAAGGCRYFSARRKAFSRLRLCPRARFNRLGARTSWRYTFPEGLAAGRYLLEVRAVDRGARAATRRIRFSVR